MLDESTSHPILQSDLDPPKVKEPSYRGKYGMSIADWMIHHQEKIVFDQVRWMGVKTLKNVLDLWIYQEIMSETRPDVLVEIGSYAGGSTMFFCHMFDIMGHGQVISLDIDRSRTLPDTPGSLTFPAIAPPPKSWLKSNSYARERRSWWSTMEIIIAMRCCGIYGSMPGLCRWEDT